MSVQNLLGRRLDQSEPFSGNNRLVQKSLGAQVAQRGDRSVQRSKVREITRWSSGSTKKFLEGDMAG